MGDDRVLSGIAMVMLRLDQMEAALGISTKIGRLRAEKAKLLDERRVAERGAEAELLAQLPALLAKQDAEFLQLVREDDEALDREALGR